MYPKQKTKNKNTCNLWRGCTTTETEVKKLEERCN
uniref:Uncharacterized protein n=1 Tax=Rhizophora mucronata TaxID=61149 RepID=A0A2P2P286_RHIMU